MDAQIASSLLAEVLAHAAAEPEREVCGLLFGDKNAIHAAVPAANVSATPSDSFEIDPAALFAAIRAERAGGARLIGHYHSHPTGDASPSPRDADAARDAGRLWLIVAVGAAACFRAEPGGPIHRAFRPMRLVVSG